MNDIYLDELPIGTRVVRNDIPQDQYNIILILKDNKFVWVDKSHNWQTKNSYDINHTAQNSEDCTIIYPYGHQTPLWKVLNGENI